MLPLTTAMLFIVAFLVGFFSAGVDADSICEGPPTVLSEQKVIIYGKKESSKWVTTILSQFETEGSPESPNLEVGQKVLNCSGKEIVQIKAVLRDIRNISAPDSFTHLSDDTLRFHGSGGINIRITNNGMTASKINPSQQSAGVLSNRPLKDDELFEIKLDKCLPSISTSLGIGISDLTPTTIAYKDWFSSGVTILYNNNLYGNHQKQNYGPNLRTLRDGARIGVQRKRNGNLHFFVNGADQGVAATGIPSPVYGVLDLYGDCIQASIVRN